MHAVSAAQTAAGAAAPAQRSRLTHLITLPCGIGAPAHFGLVALNPGMSSAAVSVLPLALPAAVEDALHGCGWHVATG